jgi:serine/threonine protein kinase
MNKSKSPATPAPSRPTHWGRVPSAGSTRRATARYRCSPAQTRATRCVAPSAERRPGRRPLETVIAGRYRLLDRIGSGGTAAVYRAEDLVLGRTVALKLLHDCFAEDQEFVERFRLEAVRQAGLRHQHIVSVFDRGEWDGTHYIAMEYVPGRSLKSLIREAAPLAPAHAIELVMQLLRATRYIHGRGIIHRDLKPDNAIVGPPPRRACQPPALAGAAVSSLSTAVRSRRSATA